jgi:hypothetical protein
MGRGNRLLRIHRLGGRVQAEGEPVSTAFNATCLCEGISPRKPGEADCKKKFTQPAAQEKFVLDNPLS